NSASVGDSRGTERPSGSAFWGMRSTGRYGGSYLRVRFQSGPPPTFCSVVGKKRKGTKEVLDVPFDLASRIGMPGSPEPSQAAPEAIRRHDGPIESERPARGRPMMIGANEPPARPLELREPERRPTGAARPMMIGLEEALVAAPPVATIEAPDEPAPA